MDVTKKVLNSILPWAILTFFLREVFALNLFGAAVTDFTNTWQKDSEALVSFGVAANRAGTIDGNYGLATGMDSAYSSQIGFPGYFARIWMGLFKTEDIAIVQEINVWLFAAVIAMITLLLHKRTESTVWLTLIASLTFSPWIEAASNNAYWLLWTWFLPSAFAILWATEQNQRKKTIWIIGVFVSFSIRFASGYEFVTSLILAAALMPIYIAASGKNSISSVKVPLMKALKVFAVGISSFFIVLIAHSFVRGSGNPLSGINDIVRNDVLRRTYGNPEMFDENTSSSLNASTFEVLNQYFFNWNTDLLQTNLIGPLGLSLPGNILFILTIASSGIVLFRIYSKDPLWKTELLLFVGAFSIPVSWFVLGKSHSAAHPHIDFILWYVFYLGVILFINVRFIFRPIRRRVRSVTNI